MQAVILAAGYATRMYPLTLDKPKALLPVSGRPILNHILDRVLALPSVTRVAVVSNAKFISQFQDWHASLPLDARERVAILNDGSASEQDRLGAIGDLLFAVKELAVPDDLLMIAGDNYFEFGLERMESVFRGRKASVIALRDLQDPAHVARKFGVAELDAGGRIIGFQEKPAEPKSALASTACYLLTRHSLKLLQEYAAAQQKPDNLGQFIAWLAQETPVYGHTFKERWHDIGSLEEYELLNAGLR
jgi:glucose-1-phosphate thymidylyltransferase